MGYASIHKILRVFRLGYITKIETNFLTNKSSYPQSGARTIDDFGKVNSFLSNSILVNYISCERTALAI